MKAPKRRRTIPGKIASGVNTSILKGFATRVRYIGSPEHKGSPNPLLQGNQPRLRADASMCPKDIQSSATVTTWLRDAFNKGAVSECGESAFPRYVWYKRDDQVFEGRLVNPELGEYKGYPIEEFEWPKGIENYYAK